MTELDYERVMYRCTCDLLARLRGEDNSSLATSLRRRKSLAASRVEISEQLDLSTAHLAKALEYGRTLAKKASSDISDAVLDQPESLLPSLRSGLALDEEVMWLDRWILLKQQEV